MMDVKFQTTNPARGRKLFGENLVLVAIIMTISNHKPRKGTETSCFSIRAIIYLSYFKPQTPQGDGNPSGIVLGRSRVKDYFKPQTPQGDGNRRGRSAFRLSRWRFQTTNPARGRKRVPSPFVHRSSRSYFKPQTPQGDGNLRAALLASLPLSSNFKPQTPQGDGNYCIGSYPQ